MSMIMKAVTAVAFVGVSSYASAKQHDSTTMAKYAAAIRKIESTNRYGVTANAGRGRTALGAYQILDTNLASWSRAALGRSVDQSEFLGSPSIQDQVFHHRFGHYVRKYGPHGAARAWLGGEGPPAAGEVRIASEARHPPTLKSSCARQADERLRRRAAEPHVTPRGRLGDRNRDRQE